uniref:Uncharacterized protein n=1 Tax=Philodina roseola TaxID=96448 RepID=B6S337_PHIRO|nr:hypothetical protein [Philodina roseola]
MTEQTNSTSLSLLLNVYVLLDLRFIMTSSNKVRRYLQHQKSPPPIVSPTTTPPASAATQFLVVDPTLSMTSMRKFRAKTSPTNQLSIPQICVDHNDDESETIKRNTVMRTLSLKPNEFIEHIPVPTNPARSFSFSLGSSSDIRSKISDDDDDDGVDDDEDSSISLASKTSSSREAFARLFHSLTFRSGLSTISKSLSVSPAAAHPCLACQTDPSNLDLISKTKKRPSIFGVLVSKLNSSTQDSTTHRCNVCKRSLVKSNSQHEQTSPISTINPVKIPVKQPTIRTKRRRSLPSIVQTLLESSNIPRRSSFFAENNGEFERKTSRSSNSLTDSEDSFGSMTKRPTINADEFNDKMKMITTEILIRMKKKLSSLVRRISILIVQHEKLKSIRFVICSTRSFVRPFVHNVKRMNVKITKFIDQCLSNSSISTSMSKSRCNNMASKQFSASVINLASSITSHRRSSATVREIESSSPVQPRKHALSDESLSTMVKNMNKKIIMNDCRSFLGQYVYLFYKYKWRKFQRKSSIFKYFGEHVVTKCDVIFFSEVLIKLFEKHQLSIETYDICLRSAPTLPLSLDQPVKHLLLDDLIVTGNEKILLNTFMLLLSIHLTHFCRSFRLESSCLRNISRTSAGKEKSEKRYSTGSATILSPPVNFMSKRKRKEKRRHLFVIEKNQGEEQPKALQTA